MYVFRLILEINGTFFLNSINQAVFVMETMFTVRQELNY
jgi:hypothetical protein